jgi:hypothetical protein
MRRAAPLPTYDVNGWTIEKRPSTFAEEFAYVARTFDANGYQTAKHGFQTKREAVTFAETTKPA